MHGRVKRKERLRRVTLLGALILAILGVVGCRRKRAVPRLHSHPTRLAQSSLPAGSAASTEAKSHASDFPSDLDSRDAAAEAPGESWELDVPALVTRSGQLRISDRKRDGFDFALVVIDGYYIGDFGEHAKREGRVYRYRGPRSEDPPDDAGFVLAPCVLTFTPIGPDFKVDEEGWCPHGVGVTFDGAYRRHLAGPKASFDCQRASQPAEKLICEDEVLADLDREMARVYRLRRAVDPNARELVEAQRGFLTKLAACTSDSAGQRQEKESAIRCLARRFVARLAVLDGDSRSYSEDKCPSLFARLKRQVESEQPILAEPRLAGVLRVLLGRGYSSLKIRIGTSSPSLKAGFVVCGWAPPGLHTMMEGFIAVGPAGDIWVAMSGETEVSSDALTLFYPESQDKLALPWVVENWHHQVLPDVEFEKRTVRYNH